MHLQCIMVGILPNPPRAPDHLAAKWNPTAGILESTVLATIHMWSMRHNKDKIIGHTVRNFHGADVFQAMCELSASVGNEKP